jgi:hypothetical protein
VYVVDPNWTTRNTSEKTMARKVSRPAPTANSIWVVSPRGTVNPIGMRGTTTPRTTPAAT